ncbi:MAG TPA: phenylalanine--tRNA ligase subunit alpha, partial [Candidatus Thermoplasmatota archaeon]|nr:phenylalanine--tRNA ligase subunit alpha [Candidatus Thermoplasmatota archaeon]
CDGGLLGRLQVAPVRMGHDLSAAETRLLLALPADGSEVPVASMVPGTFAAEGEAIQAAGAPARHGLVALREEHATLHSLSPEGLEYRAKGLPERRAVEALLAAGGSLPLAELAARAGLEPGLATVAVGWLRKKQWATVQKVPGGPVVALSGSSSPPFGPDEEVLNELAAEPRAGRQPGAISLLAQRGGILVETLRTTRFARLTPAGQAAVAALDRSAAQAVEVNQVTPDLVARWAAMGPDQKAQHRLRPFDFDVPVAVPSPGKPHPLTQLFEEVRDVFWSLGFREIGGDYVESAFWNMDALFIPQDHPAREMQDTFYLKEPATQPVPDGLFGTVRDVHQAGGGTGSTGWGGAFSRQVSERALLRTHTTVTTIRHLAARPRPPIKVFGVGRVFRNEAMDATHLPEFHQIEGILAEEEATFSTLLGVLREFYTRLGFPQVKFRPSYYPYTEPSLDVAVRWNGRWLELGGAGIFRPEVSRPLGVPCNVLAWGLGLERLAMMRLGLKDIRDLYVPDLKWLQENPLRRPTLAPQPA